MTIYQMAYLFFENNSNLFCIFFGRPSLEPVLRPKPIAQTHVRTSLQCTSGLAIQGLLLLMVSNYSLIILDDP